METRIEELRKEGRESYAAMNSYTLKLISDIIGNMPMQCITPAIVQKFMKGISRLSPATQQMRLTHLKARLNEYCTAKYD